MTNIFERTDFSAFWIISWIRFLQWVLPFPTEWSFCFLFFWNKFIYLFIFWVCWVFVSVRGLSPVPANGGHSPSRCAGLSLSRPLPLRTTGSRRAGSVVVAHGPSHSAACGIFPDQGSNPCLLHWQADSQPLLHQGSPIILFLCRITLHKSNSNLHGYEHQSINYSFTSSLAFNIVKYIFLI